MVPLGRRYKKVLFSLELDFCRVGFMAQHCKGESPFLKSPVENTVTPLQQGQWSGCTLAGGHGGNFLKR